MNPVQRIMISASPSASCLEQTADTCLWLPSEMWREKDVKILSDNNQWQVTEREYGGIGAGLVQGMAMPIFCLRGWETKNANQYGGLFPLIGVTIGIASSAVSLTAYVAASVLAMPCLGFGACLKSIALSEDEQAAEYHELALEYLNSRDIKKFHMFDEEEDSTVEGLEEKISKLENSLQQVNNSLELINTRAEGFNKTEIKGSEIAKGEISKLISSEQRKLDRQKKLLEMNSSIISAELENSRKKLRLKNDGIKELQEKRERFLEEYLALYER